MSERKAGEAYPARWRGTWFRPGVPNGVPSALAKRYAWAEIIRAVDGRQDPPPGPPAVEDWSGAEGAFRG